MTHVPREYFTEVIDVMYQNAGYVLAKHVTHKTGSVPILGNTGIEEVDGCKWELFKVYFEANDRYYGMPMEGLGLFDCMIMKSDTRQFTETEAEKFSKPKQMVMIGSHSGNESYRFTLDIKIYEDRL